MRVRIVHSFTSLLPIAVVPHSSLLYFTWSSSNMLKGSISEALLSKTLGTRVFMNNKIINNIIVVKFSHLPLPFRSYTKLDHGSTF